MSVAKTILFNDALGHRNTHHTNLLIANTGDQQIIFKFQGKAIPGIAQIISSSYEKNGKWSTTSWRVELADGIEGFAWYEDWNQGTYLGETWAQTLERVQQAAARESVQQIPNREAVERFVRSTFGAEFIAKLDEAEGVLRQPSGPILAELLAAQEDRAAATRELDAVVEDVAAIEQAQADRAAAAAMRERATKAKAAMTRGASLADLKALLAN